MTNSRILSRRISLTRWNEPIQMEKPVYGAWFDAVRNVRTASQTAVIFIVQRFVCISIEPIALTLEEVLLPFNVINGKLGYLHGKHCMKYKNMIYNIII